MNGKKAKAARQAQRASAPRATSKGRNAQPLWTSWRGIALATAILAVVGASFVVPGVFDKKKTVTGHNMAAMVAGDGSGLKAGSAVPAFSERDLLSGQTISSQSVYDHKTLLFFSEGVMCQACFQQIQGLQQVGAALEKRGIQLVSVTPDSPSDLKQAPSQYGITTPLIADDNRTMSGAFNTLGKGMHADTPGHAFALIDKGKVIWYRDYWLPPDRSMYVAPAKLLKDIPS